VAKTTTSNVTPLFEGRIKGAVNVEYKSVLEKEDAEVDLNGDGEVTLLDASFTFKSLKVLKALFSDAGYKRGDTVYTYCRTGTRASNLAFASSAILGYPTRLYDGSWTSVIKNGGILIPSPSGGGLGWGTSF